MNTVPMELPGDPDSMDATVRGETLSCSASSVAVQPLSWRAKRICWPSTFRASAASGRMSIFFRAMSHTLECRITDLRRSLLYVTWAASARPAAVWPTGISRRTPTSGTDRPSASSALVLLPNVVKILVVLLVFLFIFIFIIIVVVLIGAMLMVLFNAVIDILSIEIVEPVIKISSTGETARL